MTTVLLVAFCRQSSSAQLSLLAGHSETRVTCLASRFADTALAYTWVRETRGLPNHSPVIDSWQTEVAGRSGIYWCMVYVWKMASKASIALGVKNPLKRTASCWQQLAYAANLGSTLKVVAVGAEFGGVELLRGDVFIMRADGRTDPELIGKAANGHTGCVVQDKGVSAETVEGNTSANGSRNGDRVAVRTRLKKSFLAIIRM